MVKKSYTKQSIKHNIISYIDQQPWFDMLAQLSRRNHLIFFLNLLFAAGLCWCIASPSPRLHDILLLWCVINCLWLRPILFWLFSPLLLILLIYAPIGAQFGYPTTGMIASLFETNLHEFLEFFDLKTLGYCLLVLIGSITIYHLTKNIAPTQQQRRFFKYFSAILAVLFLVNIFSIKHQKINLGYSEIFNFVPNTWHQYQQYRISHKKLQELKTQQDNWQITSYAPRYQTYILVIGESASRDYLSAYGYPVATSPFLETAHGTKYTHAFAPAAYTIQSVPRLLTIPNQHEADYVSNIITLANKAGMQTYWLSNQERMGEYDNEIGYISAFAQTAYYLGEDQPLSARYDHQLLPKIQEVINHSSAQPKLIIVHLMGSHARFSKRIDANRAQFDFSDKYLSDYLSSIRQTDQLLKEIHQSLGQSKQAFSMIYLSDHGLSPIALKHGPSQFSLKMPLFQLSSDATSQVSDERIISGLGFVWFLTEWLGITTNNQVANTFMNSYHVNSLADVHIFDDTIKPYTTLEPFDGTLLMPTPEELQKIR